MHLKVFMKLKKNLKTLSSGQKTPKNPKKPKKTQKTPKNTKIHWAGFLQKNTGFFQPWIKPTKPIQSYRKNYETLLNLYRTE